jgi:AcrR family transcriptional regulator
MKAKILQKASDLFLTLGFKSVTMDDIAYELGMSKKTIYAHYPTKLKLVQATTFYVLDRVNETICEVCSGNHNPIEELFTIKSMVKDQLKGEKSSPHYQLQKYYPRVYKQLRDKQFDLINRCISENLQRGIKDGYYRMDIDIDLITKFYLNGNMSLTDLDLFPQEKYSLSEIKEAFMEYHIRAISTQKGLKILSNILNK